jgi:acetyl esterase/lipase
VNRFFRSIGFQPVRHLLAFCTALLILGQSLAWSDDPANAPPPRNVGYPPHFDDAREIAYKKVGDVELKLYVFSPQMDGKQLRPAIVFFFGGGWKQGAPGQFAPQCRYFASRGMAAITADYRVASRNKVKPAECVADAKSAIRYVRSHAGELGVDPDKIIAAGGSAGGHLAAATATLDDLNDDNDDKAISPTPNALVLFNPVLAVAPLPELPLEGFAKNFNEESLGAKPEDISPAHHIHSGGPPAIIFHGQADDTVPYASVEAFAKLSIAAGNRCELVGYEGQNHGFFNHGKKPTRYFNDTLTKADEFLASLKYLAGPPTVATFFPVAAEAPTRNLGLWNLDELKKTPEATWGEVKDGVQEVYYAGEPYQGKPTRVFAYFSEPEGDGPFPAMVLVHGGGGKAFSEWVRHWAKRGYAALAMDLAGNGPSGRLVDGGPDQNDGTKFRKFTPNDAKDMWTYHAVADVIHGHSLLASRKEVDKNRIGITGISWGGYLTCIVAGLDDRLKVAIPVYGCGFLAESSVWQDRMAKMPAEDRDAWTKHFDPSQFVGATTCPILFLNGTNDFAYPPDSYKKTYQLPKSPVTISMVPRLPHGHIWTFPIVDLFVDSVLNKGVALPKLGTMAIEGEMALAPVSAETKLTKFELHYTTDSGPWQKREWKAGGAELKDGKVIAKLPQNRPLVCYLAVTDERGVMVSTQHEELK